MFPDGGRALVWLGAFTGYRTIPNSECRYGKNLGVRLRAIRFVVERETAQTAS